MIRSEDGDSIVVSQDLVDTFEKASEPVVDEGHLGVVAVASPRGLTGDTEALDELVVVLSYGACGST